MSDTGKWAREFGKKQDNVHREFTDWWESKTWTHRWKYEEPEPCSMPRCDS
jgi:hypothetical protein